MNIGCPTFWRVGLLARKTQRFQIPILLVALPREASKPRPINELTDGLGKNGVTEIQGVLRPTPKPSRLRRGLAQTASRIASAMIGTVLLTSHAKAGGFWVPRADGWIYIDQLAVAFIGAVVAVVDCVFRRVQALRHLVIVSAGGSAEARIRRVLRRHDRTDARTQAPARCGYGAGRKLHQGRARQGRTG